MKAATLTSSRRTSVIVVLVVILVAIAGWLLIRGSDGSPGTPEHSSSGATSGPLTTTAGAAESAPTAPGTRRVETTRTTQRSWTTNQRTSRTVAAERDPVSGLLLIEVAALPPHARRTLELIADGGPFPYPRNDNRTYYNNNRLLPQRRSGYYKEFTVPTPGERDRGARRIVTGQAGEKYYTADHYDSFRRIKEN